MRIRTGSVPNGSSLPSSEELITMSFDDVTKLVRGLTARTDDLGSSIRKTGALPRVPQFIDLTFGRSRRNDSTRGNKS